jgi:hypothetical protein
MVSTFAVQEASHGVHGESIARLAVMTREKSKVPGVPDAMPGLVIVVVSCQTGTAKAPTNPWAVEAPACNVPNEADAEPIPPTGSDPETDAVPAGKLWTSISGDMLLSPGIMFTAA